MRIELIAATPDDTIALGEAIASLLRPGDAVALTGELGAGKTTFVRGAAKGLGFDGAVASPTFTLVREYPATIRIYHVDVYRLERLQEALDLGLDEMVADGGVVFVEWGDAVEGLLPDEHLLVELTMDDGSEARSVVLIGIGSSWSPRWERLERLTEPWGRAA
jgi:tRNA threonylcarbamoyladenosine biosynthesis protein TsaE